MNDRVEGQGGKAIRVIARPRILCCEPKPGQRHWCTACTFLVERVNGSLGVQYAAKRRKVQRNHRASIINIVSVCFSRRRLQILSTRGDACHMLHDDTSPAANDLLTLHTYLFYLPHRLCSFTASSTDCFESTAHSPSSVIRVHRYLG
jgi:hypothetical protein